MKLFIGKKQYRREKVIYIAKKNFKEYPRLTSIGLGSSFASVSASWETGVYSILLKKLKSKKLSKSLDERFENFEEVVLRGYLYFCDNKKLGLETAKIEKETWYPIILTETPVNTNQLKKEKYIVTYFNSSCFRYPENCWKHIEKEIVIYGVVFPVESKVAIKALGAACFE